MTKSEPVLADLHLPNLICAAFQDSASLTVWLVASQCIVRSI